MLANFLTVAEAAARIGCHQSYVRQLLMSGALTGVKFNGRAWAIDRAAVERYAKPKKTGRPRKFLKRD